MNQIVKERVENDFVEYDLEVGTPYFLPEEVCESSGWYGEFLIYWR